MLRLVDENTTTEQITGKQVMDEIGELLHERLPLVPLDDDFRNTLAALHATTYGFRRDRRS